MSYTFLFAGGNGYDGLDGRDALRSQVDCNFSENDCICAPNNGKTKIKHFEDSLTDFMHIKIYTLENKGECGTKGGNSGRGGAGGINGYSGSFINRFEKIHDYKVKRIGESGNSGLSGLRGFQGQSVIREYTIKIPRQHTKILTFGLKETENGYTDKHLNDEPHTKQRCDNPADGFRPQDKNTKSQLQPQKQEIYFHSHVIEYIKFITSLKLNKSRLIEREFCKYLISNTKDLLLDIVPSVSILIEKFKILDSFENRKLLLLFQNQISEYFNMAKTSNEKRILQYIYATIKSSILRYNYGEETVLVVNSKKFIEITRDEIKKWEGFEKQDIRNIYRTNYENNLKKKIEEAMKFVTSLQDDIEKEENKMNSNIKEVLQKVSELKNVSQQNEMIYQKQKQDLEQKLKTTLILKTTLGVLKAGCSALAFLGPKGQIAGSIIQTGIDIGTTIASAQTDKVTVSKPTSFDANLDKTITEYEKLLKAENQKELTKIEKEVAILEANENSFQTNEIVTKSLDVRISELSESGSKYELQMKYAEYMSESKQVNSQEKQKYKSQIDEAKKKFDSENLKAEKTGKTLEMVSKGLKTVKVAADVYSDYIATKKKGNEEIEILTEEMKKNSKTFNNLDKIEKSIDEFQNGLFKQVRNELNEFSTSLDKKSLIPLEFSKWEISKKLADLRGEIISVMDKIDGNLKLTHSVNRVEQAFKTMIEIYTVKNNKCLKRF